MKKLLFILFATTTIFSSCSSDNDPISQETDQDLIKYTVNLKVKSVGFEVDKTPLTRGTDLRPSFLQVIVYKESGTVYSDTIIDQAKLGIDESMTSISLKLPKGNYFLSVLNSRYMPDLLANYIISPYNYNTDYYNKKNRNNDDVYYYTSSLNVTTESNNNNIILEPMWSNIKSININFPSTFKYPAGTDTYITQIVNKYYNFEIKSKLAKTLDTFFFKEFDWYILNNPAPSRAANIISKAEDKDLYLEICYIKKENYNGGGYITKIQRIKLPVEIENGMNYTISGTVPAVDSIDSNLMNIGLEPFKDFDVSL